MAVKLEIAYLRDFAFGNPPRQDAQRLYAKYANHGRPSVAEYKILQDFFSCYCSRVWAVGVGGALTRYERRRLLRDIRREPAATGTDLQ